MEVVCVSLIQALIGEAITLEADPFAYQDHVFGKMSSPSDNARARGAYAYSQSASAGPSTPSHRTLTKGMLTIAPSHCLNHLTATVTSISH
jgi:hypothetical protein